MQAQISSTLQILLVRFNGQILIPFATASASVGIPEQTARNLLCKKKFPIPTVPNTNGTRIFIHISDLAEYVDSLRVESSNPKRGRPSKASKFQAIQRAKMEGV